MSELSTSTARGSAEDVERLLVGRELPASGFPLKYETRYELINRFLISCDYLYEHCTNEVVEHLYWREKHGVDEIARKPLRELLHLETDEQVREFVHCFPVVEQGEDKNGKQVLYFLASQLDIKRARQMCSTEMIFQYLIWTRERSFARFKSTNTFPSPPPYYISVMDCRNVRLGMATNADFQLFLKQIAEVDSQYAGRIGKLIIVNIPFFFQVVWSVAKMFVGSDLEKKILICTSGMQKQALLDAMGGDESKLPQNLGGKAPALPLENTFCPQVNYLHDQELVYGNDVVAVDEEPSQPVEVAVTDEEPPQPIEVAVEEPQSIEATDESKIESPMVKTPATVLKLIGPIPPLTKQITLLPASTSPRSFIGRRVLFTRLQAEYAHADTKQAKQELKSKLAACIVKLERDTRQFECDMLLLRARKSKLPKLAVNHNVFRTEGEVQQALDLLQQERETWGRAMAFAKNYIELLNQEWVGKQRNLRQRLEHVMQENHALRKTVKDSMQ